MAKPVSLSSTYYVTRDKQQDSNKKGGHVENDPPLNMCYSDKGEIFKRNHYPWMNPIWPSKKCSDNQRSRPHIATQRFLQNIHK